jgi:hypothetical protein
MEIELSPHDKTRGCIMTRLFSIVLFFLLLTASLSADVINVPQDQTSIQDGINTAVNGDTVLVAEGTYVENISFMGKAITVASHYLVDDDTSHISNTIIDGSEPANADSGSVVYFISGEDTNSVLLGFTITHGTGTVTMFISQSTNYPFRGGGGILCYNSGARILYNKIKYNNNPHYENCGGGGIAGYPLDSSVHLVIENNEISYNSVNGGATYGGAISLVCNATIKDNEISHNTSTGDNYAFGAVDCWSDENIQRKVLIQNNRVVYNKAIGENQALAGGINLEGGMSGTIIGNEVAYNELTYGEQISGQALGAGIYLLINTAKSIIDRNTIYLNKINGVRGYGGGITFYNSENNSLITNNLIYENSASFGGGIHTRDTDLILINNTIVNNSAEEGGGLGIASSTHSIILNTIFWGNEANGYPNIQGEHTIAYSNIEEMVYEGEGNLSIDPLFEDSLYHLADNSPCIVAGIDSFKMDGDLYAAPLADLSGNQRPSPYGSYPDMGAHENEVKVAYAHNLKIEKTFVKPDVDSVKFAVNVENPDAHNLSVTIDLHTLDNVFVESIELYDDGMHGDDESEDNVWGNHYIPDDEHTLRVSVTTNDNTEEISRTRPNLTRFTSIGRIYVEKWSPYIEENPFPEPGELFPFWIHLQNDGLIQSGEKISTRIYSDDSRIEISADYTTYNEITAGNSVKSRQGNAFVTSEDFPGDTTILLPVMIYSEGIHFWTDTVSFDIISGITALQGKIPTAFALEQNYPNPFNPKTNITFALPKPENVRIVVYNALGQRVAILVNKKMQAGYYEVDFDATNLSSGIYMYKIVAGEYQDVKKMVLLR